MPYGGKFSKGLIFENFISSQASLKIFSEINNFMVHFRNVHSHPQKKLLKYYKHIEHSKKERIQLNQMVLWYI